MYSLCILIYVPILLPIYTRHIWTGGRWRLKAIRGAPENNNGVNSEKYWEAVSSIRNSSGLPGCSLGWNPSRGAGPGLEAPSNPNWLTSAGLLPGPDVNPGFIGQVETRLWFHFAVPTTSAKLWFQLSIRFLIVSWYDQYVDCAVLSALSSPAFRFAIWLIFVEWLWNKGKYKAKFAGVQ
jgi:hypothetical protein